MWEIEMGGGEVVVGGMGEGKVPPTLKLRPFVGDTQVQTVSRYDVTEITAAPIQSMNDNPCDI